MVFLKHLTVFGLRFFLHFLEFAFVSSGFISVSLPFLHFLVTIGFCELETVLFLYSSSFVAFEVLELFEFGVTMFVIRGDFYIFSYFSFVPFFLVFQLALLDH